jgi:hypothetical protein
MNPGRTIYPHIFRNMFYVYVRILTPVLNNISYSPNLPSAASKCDVPVHNHRPARRNRQTSGGRKIIEVGNDLRTSDKFDSCCLQ